MIIFSFHDVPCIPAFWDRYPPVHRPCHLQCPSQHQRRLSQQQRRLSQQQRSLSQQHRRPSRRCNGGQDGWTPGNPSENERKWSNISRRVKVNWHCIHPINFRPCAFKKLWHQALPHEGFKQNKAAVSAPRMAPATAGRPSERAPVTQDKCAWEGWY